MNFLEELKKYDPNKEKLLQIEKKKNETIQFLINNFESAIKSSAIEAVQRNSNCISGFFAYEIGWYEDGSGGGFKFVDSNDSAKYICIDRVSETGLLYTDVPYGKTSQNCIHLSPEETEYILKNIKEKVKELGFKNFSIVTSQFQLLDYKKHKKLGNGCITYKRKKGEKAIILKVNIIW